MEPSGYQRQKRHSGTTSGKNLKKGKKKKKKEPKKPPCFGGPKKLSPKATRKGDKIRKGKINSPANLGKRMAAKGKTKKGKIEEDRKGARATPRRAAMKLVSTAWRRKVGKKKNGGPRTLGRNPRCQRPGPHGGPGPAKKRKKKKRRKKERVRKSANRGYMTSMINLGKKRRDQAKQKADARVGRQKLGPEGKRQERGDKEIKKKRGCWPRLPQKAQYKARDPGDPQSEKKSKWAGTEGGL